MVTYETLQLLVQFGIFLVALIALLLGKSK